MRVLIVLVIGVLLLAVTSVVAQSDDEAVDEMPETQRSYLVCDWGLLTTEASTEQGPIFIEITSPADYGAVEGTSFTLEGIGAGPYEGNIIVEVSLQDGEVVFEDFALLQAEEIGAVGDWSIDVDLGELDSATEVFIRAYSTSPADGSIIAFDSLRLNANSEFGLRYVDITTPYFGAGVNSSPLLVAGMAGAAFENNIVIEVRDFDSGDILAEAFATIETDELAGSEPFSAEVSFDAEPGTAIEVYAYQPAIADDEEVEISDIEFVIVSPLGQTYDRFLTIQRDDPIAGAEDVCATAEAEFDNENVDPLVINDVVLMETRSMMPLVNVSIDAAGSSNCPAPLRARTVRDGSDFTVEVYYDKTEPVACTADLAPINLTVSLGTLPDPDFTLTVNGEIVE